jgi:AcrR family transcriptional regulator
MARPQRADQRELLIAGVAKQLIAGEEAHVSKVCRQIGIVPSLANHYFPERTELIREAWLRIILSSIDDDYETLNAYAEKTDWAGVEEFIYGVFSGERHAVRVAHIRGIAASKMDAAFDQALMQAQLETTKLWRQFLQRFSDAGTVDAKASLDAIAIIFSALPIGISAVHEVLSETERREMADAWLKMLRAVL